MKIQALGMMVALAALAATARLPAQEEPAKPPTADQFLDLNRIHNPAWRSSRLFLGTRSPHNANVWSEKQCRQCHTATHNTVQQGQLLLATDTVANSLGIEAAPLDTTLRAHLNIDEKSGLVLSSVPEGSEGAKAGLKTHDVVLNIDQHAVNEPARFNELIGTLGGKKAQFGLLRHGKPLSLDVTVPQMPLAVLDSLNLDLGTLWNDNRYRIGVTLSEADDTLRSHLKLPAGEGLVVTEVMADSPAAKMGVKLHDVLIELEGKHLTTVEAINAQIQEIKDKTVLLKLLRSGQEVTCQITPKKSDEQVQELRDWVVVGNEPHHRAIVRWLANGQTLQDPQTEGTGKGDVASQVAELKKQLAELGKTVEKLEAAITPPAANEQKAPDEGGEKK